MSLDNEQSSRNETGHSSAQAMAENSPKTLEAARTLLREVKPKVLEILGREKLRVSLDSMDIMRPERGDQERAHVMWVGPADGKGVKKFKEVARTHDVHLSTTYVGTNPDIARFHTGNVQAGRLPRCRGPAIEGRNVGNLNRCIILTR